MDETLMQLKLEEFYGVKGKSILDGKKTKKIYLHDFTMVGAKFSDWAKIEKDWDDIIIPKDAVLFLKRHPENEYDPLAIGVYYKNVRIGWMPKRMNSIYANLLDGGKALIARAKAEIKNKEQDLEASIYMLD